MFFRNKQTQTKGHIDEQICVASKQAVLLCFIKGGCAARRDQGETPLINTVLARSSWP